MYACTSSTTLITNILYMPQMALCMSLSNSNYNRKNKELSYWAIAQSSDYTIIFETEMEKKKLGHFAYNKNVKVVLQ